MNKGLPDKGTRLEEAIGLAHLSSWLELIGARIFAIPANGIRSLNMAEFRYSWLEYVRLQVVFGTDRSWRLQRTKNR